MRVNYSDTRGTHGLVPRARYRRVLARITTILVVSSGVTALGGLTATSALANRYTGLLHGGTASITAGTQDESGGFVYGADSWTAPSGVAFGGFAYTAANFWSYTSDSVGGISAGFGGDGSANQPTYLYPWTSDCAITNSGHDWVYSAGGTVAGTTGNQICVTGGSTGGWNYDNSEILNTAPGTYPSSDYSTLWLTVFCQAAACRYAGNATTAAGAQVTAPEFLKDPGAQAGG